jgi:hypothetical protein
MAQFESLVRPFANVDTAPTPGVISVPTPVPNAVLIVVGAGMVKSGTYSYSYNLQCYADGVQKELSQLISSPFSLPAPAAAIPTSGVRTRRGFWPTRSMAPVRRF